eukprot:CAMPEP_0114982624 /NCGR_PEP_ID=MMETSP0216-20121206/6232_1 /TAXON_ID=223996 /ORGANISM="Protocruzia adherens, Strain Boccale" /LENGTH=414 /DNA_ID=CAMNT_0002344485 /DNA_START=710 /DNA_END=1951 /DNA_ORIENTATION=+
MGKEVQLSLDHCNTNLTFLETERDSLKKEIDSQFDEAIAVLNRKREKLLADLEVKFQEVQQTQERRSQSLTLLHNKLDHLSRFKIKEWDQKFHTQNFNRYAMTFFNKIQGLQLETTEFTTSQFKLTTVSKLATLTSQIASTCQIANVAKVAHIRQFSNPLSPRANGHTSLTNLTSPTRGNSSSRVTSKLQQVTRNPSAKIIQRSSTGKGSLTWTGYVGERMLDLGLGGIMKDSTIIDDCVLRRALNVLPPRIKKMELLLRMTECDRMSSDTFHRLCDKKGPTVTFIQLATGHIFGYYVPIDWIKKKKYTLCDSCWIFSLTDGKGRKSTKFPIKVEKKHMAIFQSDENPCLGENIQGNQDLFVKWDNLSQSCSNLGNNYKLPRGCDGKTVLAGKPTDWNIIEIEVYSVSFQGNRS